MSACVCTIFFKKKIRWNRTPDTKASSQKTYRRTAARQRKERTVGLGANMIRRWRLAIRVAIGVTITVLVALGVPRTDGKSFPILAATKVKLPDPLGFVFCPFSSNPDRPKEIQLRGTSNYSPLASAIFPYSHDFYWSRALPER
jgi:hypothetical protein